MSSDDPIPPAGHPDGKVSLARWRALARRLDPVTPLVAIAAGIVYTLHGFGGPLNRDLSIYSYAGQQFAEGHPPYLAILNRAGPLAHMLPGIGAWVGRQLGASSDVFSMRFFFMLMAAAAVAMSYALGRDLLGSRAWGLVTAATLMALHGWIEYASDGPREKTAMVLFVVVALYSVLRQRWFTVGLFLGLATLTWQPSFVVVAGAGAALLVGVEGWRARGLGLLRIAVGGLLPAAIFVVWYAAMGELQTFVDDFYLINARYTQQDGFFDRPDWGWTTMTRGYDWVTWALLAGWATVIVASIVVLVRRRRSARDAGIVAIGTATVAGMLWSCIAYDAWPDLFFILPMAAVGVALLLSVVTARLDRRVLWAVATAWVLVIAWDGTHWSVTTNRDGGLELQRRGTEVVLSHLPADATLLTVNGPEPLVLGRRTNPTRIMTLGHGMEDYIDATYPGGLAGFASWIADSRFPVLAIRKPGPTLKPMLKEYYCRAGSLYRGPHIFVDRDLGRDLCVSLHADLNRVWTQPPSH